MNYNVLLICYLTLQHRMIIFLLLSKDYFLHLINQNNNNSNKSHLFNNNQKMNCLLKINY